MNKLLAVLCVLSLTGGLVMAGVVQSGKDKTSQWYGPYGDGIYYRYIQSYLGMDQWSKDYDAYRYDNRTSSQVEVTWDMSSGTHNSLIIKPSSKGPKTSLAPGERIISISVKKL